MAIYKSKFTGEQIDGGIDIARTLIYLVEDEPIPEQHRDNIWQRNLYWNGLVYRCHKEESPDLYFLTFDERDMTFKTIYVDLADWSWYVETERQVIDVLDVTEYVDNETKLPEKYRDENFLKNVVFKYHDSLYISKYDNSETKQSIKFNIQGDHVYLTVGELMVYTQYYYGDYQWLVVNNSNEYNLNKPTTFEPTTRQLTLSSDGRYKTAPIDESLLLEYQLARFCLSENYSVSGLMPKLHSGGPPWKVGSYHGIVQTPTSDSTYEPIYFALMIGSGGQNVISLSLYKKDGTQLNYSEVTVTWPTTLTLEIYN